jgi:hypothetical protein
MVQISKRIQAEPGIEFESALLLAKYQNGLREFGFTPEQLRLCEALDRRCGRRSGSAVVRGIVDGLAEHEADQGSNR